MKIAAKLILAAVLSLSIGIAAATPLMISELNIRPWTDHVQGPTAIFDLDVVYANFTVQNPDTPITKTTGPTISYFAVVNVTNPSEQRALLLGTDFWAGQQVENITGQAPFDVKGNWSTGEGAEAKGAWVDGVWYNVTWVDSYPFFDANGTMTQSPFPQGTSGYWIEGVQIYQRTSHIEGGATITSTYMNMNGTWTDVTGRITVDLPQDGPTYSMRGPVADQQIFYQKVDPDGGGMHVDTTEINGTKTTVITYGNQDTSQGYISTKTINTGTDAFDNHFAPGDSRLIMVYGSWNVTTDWVSMNGNGFINPVQVIQSGNVQIKTTMHTVVDVNPVLGNNTFMDTWSDATVIRQLTLTQLGDSYIYNAALGSNQQFRLDQFGAEAFITSGS